MTFITIIIWIIFLIMTCKCIETSKCAHKNFTVIIIIIIIVIIIIIIIFQSHSSPRICIFQ